MKKVSVIVPVYNAQDNIANAIDSLLKQTLDDIEIILINDGSKDNSLIVLKEYEKKYPHKIKVIDQENLGPGGARNTGLKIAKGEYIGFLDSDDTQNSKMYETMYRKAKTGNFDLVVCDVNAIYDKKTVTIKSGIDADHFNNEFIKKDMIFSYTVLWNKLIKKEIATSISFSNRLWYEDVEYLFKLFPLVNSIGTVKRRFCNYYQNDNSITYTYNKKIYDIVTVMNNLVDYYKKNKLYDQYKDEIEYSYVRYLYGTFIRRIAKTKNKTEYKKAVSKAIEEVENNFPNYKKNKYIKSGGAKNIYFKHFNKNLSNIVYIFEKGGMRYGLQNHIEKLFSFGKRD